MTTLHDATAVVTGASSGIGRATALALAREGTRTVLVARSEERLRRLAEEIGQSAAGSSTGRRADEVVALVVPADVTRDADVEEMARRVRTELGVPDILVNNAGIGHWSSFDEMSERQIREIMEVNFFGSLRCTRAFLPGMLERGSGTVAFVTSGLGEFAFPNSSIYCASKFALHGFARSLRGETEPRGVRVLLMIPGGTDTEFFDTNDFPPEIVETYMGQDMDTPEEVAERLVDGIAAGRRRVTMSWKSDLMLRLSYLFPGVRARLVSRMGERILGGDRDRSGSAGRS